LLFRRQLDFSDSCESISHPRSFLAGQRSEAEVIAAWMNSPGHRANILGNFKLFGGAVVNNYWTQTFASSPSRPGSNQVCPDGSSPVEVPRAVAPRPTTARPIPIRATTARPIRIRTTTQAPEPTETATTEILQPTETVEAPQPTETLEAPQATETAEATTAPAQTATVISQPTLPTQAQNWQNWGRWSSNRNNRNSEGQTYYVQFGEKVGRCKRSCRRRRCWLKCQF